eukprot:355136-Chlamydomonas_euryale.AAC.8
MPQLPPHVQPTWGSRNRRTCATARAAVAHAFRLHGVRCGADALFVALQAWASGRAGCGRSIGNSPLRRLGMHPARARHPQSAVEDRGLS